MEQIDILRHAVEALERMNTAYMVVGSFASIAYGESRFTQDIDIVAAFQLKHVEELLAAFPPDDFYLRNLATNRGESRCPRAASWAGNALKSPACREP